MLYMWVVGTLHLLMYSIRRIYVNILPIHNIYIVRILSALDGPIVVITTFQTFFPF